MRVLVVSLGLGLGLGSGACGDPDTFVCEINAQCTLDGQVGTCELTGLCSFPDDECDSGHRYGEQAGSLSGICVGEEPSGSGSGSGSSGSVTPEPTSTSTTGSPSSTTQPVTSGADSTSMGPAGSIGSDDATSTTSTTTTTTGPGDPDGPYGACQNGNQCLVQASICLTPYGYPVCGPPCSELATPSDECPPSPSGGPGGCFTTPEGFVCLLLCEDEIPCPRGMICQPIDGGPTGACVWP